MNLLITGAWQQASEYIEQIEAMGHRVSFLQYEKDSLDCDYEWVEGVICNGLFLYHSIEKFTNLKYIQLTSAGMDRIPLDYIKEKGMCKSTFLYFLTFSLFISFILYLYISSVAKESLVTTFCCSG